MLKACLSGYWRRLLWACLEITVNEGKIRDKISKSKHKKSAIWHSSMALSKTHRDSQLNSARTIPRQKLAAYSDLLGSSASTASAASICSITLPSSLMSASDCKPATTNLTVSPTSYPKSIATSYSPNARITP